MAEKKQSKTKYISLRGIAYWPKLFEFNRDKEGPDGAWEHKGGATCIDLEITPEEFDKLKEAGSAIERPEDDTKSNKLLENGNYRIKFKRFWESPYPQYAGPPQVAHADGSPWDPDEDGLIGNGSEVVVYLSIYETKGKRGTRMDGVQVIEHIPYESENSGGGGFKMPDLTKSEAKGEDKSKAKKSTKKEPQEDLEEDEIPF